jgi:hypothetical protein
LPDHLKLQTTIDIFYLEPIPSMAFKKIIDNFLLAEINLSGLRWVYHKVKYALISCFIPLMWVVIGAGEITFEGSTFKAPNKVDAL